MEDSAFAGRESGRSGVKVKTDRDKPPAEISQLANKHLTLFTLNSFFRILTVVSTVSPVALPMSRMLLLKSSAALWLQLRS